MIVQRLLELVAAGGGHVLRVPGAALQQHLVPQQQAAVAPGDGVPAHPAAVLAVLPDAVGDLRPRRAHADLQHRLGAVLDILLQGEHAVLQPGKVPDALQRAGPGLKGALQVPEGQGTASVLLPGERRHGGLRQGIGLAVPGGRLQKGKLRRQRPLRRGDLLQLLHPGGKAGVQRQIGIGLRLALQHILPGQQAAEALLLDAVRRFGEVIDLHPLGKAVSARLRHRDLPGAHPCGKLVPEHGPGRLKAPREAHRHVPAGIFQLGVFQRPVPCLGKAAVDALVAADDGGAVVVVLQGLGLARVGEDAPLGGAFLLCRHPRGDVLRPGRAGTQADKQGRCDTHHGFFHSFLLIRWRSLVRIGLVFQKNVPFFRFPRNFSFRFRSIWVRNEKEGDRSC